MAGIRISSEVVDCFNQLKFSHQMRFFTCKLSSDLSEVIVDTSSPRDSSWEDLEGSLPANDCRYAFFNFDYEQEGTTRSKVVFISWCPDTSGIKPRMLYASTKSGLKKVLEGIGCDLQATDASELDKQEVLTRVVRGYRA